MLSAILTSTFLLRVRSDVPSSARSSIPGPQQHLRQPHRPAAITVAGFIASVNPQFDIILEGRFRSLAICKPVPRIGLLHNHRAAPASNGLGGVTSEESLATVLPVS